MVQTAEARRLYRRQLALATGPEAEARKERERELNRQRQRRHRARLTAAVANARLRTPISEDLHEPMVVDTLQHLSRASPRDGFLERGTTTEPSPPSSHPSPEAYKSRVRELNRERQRRYRARLAAAANASPRAPTPDSVRKGNRDRQRRSRARRAEHPREQPPNDAVQGIVPAQTP